MGRAIVVVLPILASLFSLLAFVKLHSVSAQNVTNMTAGTNMTNGARLNLELAVEFFHDSQARFRVICR